MWNNKKGKYWFSEDSEWKNLRAYTEIKRKDVHGIKYGYVSNKQMSFAEKKSS